jgi:hypothetical protein
MKKYQMCPLPVHLSDGQSTRYVAAGRNGNMWSYSADIVMCSV